MDVIVARRRKQQGFRLGPEQLAHARQQEMADDFGPGEPPGSRVTMVRTVAVEPVGKRS